MAKLLDCTMRDGGYYNDWDFSEAFVQDYLDAVAEIGIDYVELGFRFFRNAGHRGPWAYTPDERIEDFNLPSGPKWGVMVNLSEFAGLSSEKQVQALFKKDSPLTFVRVACHFDELAEVEQVARALGDLGLEVGVNLMQVSERTNHELGEFAKLCNSIGVDFAYVADSLGALTPQRTAEITDLLVNELESLFGIHAHDNKNLALENTLTAMNLGARMLDSTMLGMGRGAGNTPTENLVSELVEKTEYNLAPSGFGFLNEFLDSHMHPLKEQYKWGTKLPYRLAADWSIHPTFVQELAEDGVNGSRLIGLLDNLRSKPATRFDRNLLLEQPKAVVENSTYTVHSKGLAEVYGHDVLIIGAGTNAIPHLKELHRFAETNHLNVYKLNMAATSDLCDIPTFRLAANLERLKSIGTSFWSTPEEKIMPFLNSERLATRERLSVIPITVGAHEIGPDAEGVVVPNNLTLSYALAVSMSQGATKIYFAGIDGYSEFDSRYPVLQETISIFQNRFPLINIASLTPTKLPIEVKSPYWRGLS